MLIRILHWWWRWWWRFLTLCVFSDDSTGLYSVYTEFEGNEIMFHVSTLLPFTPNNRWVNSVSP
jgi:hypothetical protein